MTFILSTPLKDLYDYDKFKRNYYCGICFCCVVVGAGFATGQEIFHSLLQWQLQHLGRDYNGLYCHQVAFLPNWL